MYVSSDWISTSLNWRNRTRMVSAQQILLWLERPLARDCQSYVETMPSSTVSTTTDLNSSISTTKKPVPVNC